MGWEIVDAVLRWAVRLVFSPVVWLGIVVAVVALVLHVAGGVLVRRSARNPGSARPSGARGVTAGSEKALYGSPTTTPAPKAGAEPATRRPGKQKQDSLIDDQDDIEAILRKHGIS